jgi:hypothetical protein
MLRIALVGVVASTAALLQASCAQGVVDESGGPVLFSTDAVEPRTLCVERQCPAPFASCGGAGGPCSVNLSNDVNHCGSCETPCPETTWKTHGTYVCNGGQCRLACLPLHADCNHSADDGCEIETDSDPKNCGACGTACKPGVLCWKGACGCPKGFTQCGDDCKKLDSDDLNCSACGIVCKAPASDADPRWICGPGVTPPDTKWTCASSACKLLCKPGRGDCNNQFCGDGCETDLLFDPQNCGACGHKCDPGQWCAEGTCMCPAGTTACGDQCVDLKRDPTNCGSCGNWCPGLAAMRPGEASTGSPSCENGVCAYVCFPGYANCDGRLENGCEVDLRSDQKHCGDCATSCDVAAGQPCVSGKCLTKPCEKDEIR